MTTKNCNCKKDKIIEDVLPYLFWKLRNSIYRLIFCKTGFHKWNTYEGGTGLGKFGLDKALFIERGYVICKFCNKHLCNYITEVRVNK